MTTTQSTNAQVWETLGWELRSLNIPTRSETLTRWADQLHDAAQEPACTIETHDEPLFGVHIREAARAVSRLLR
jgi:hypothetical protein